MRGFAWIPCAVLLTAAACSRVGPNFTDAPGDQPIDAAVDVPVGPATITVLRENNETGPGMPVANTKVFFIKPDGSYELKMTGADGKASADVVPGTTILTARQYNSAGTIGFHLIAFGGMEPGSDVVAGPPVPDTLPTTVGRITFTTPVFAGASSYQFSLPCTNFVSQNVTSTVVELQAGCNPAATATIASKVFGSTGQLVAYSTEGSVNLPQLVNMTHALPTYQSPATAMMNFTSIPNTVANASTDIHLRGQGVEYSSFIGGAVVSGPTLTLSGPIAPVGVNTFERSVFQASTPTLLPLYHYKRSASQQLASSLDVGANALPFVTRPSFDAVSLTAAWTKVGGASGHTPDLIVVRGNYFVRASGVSVDFTLLGPAFVDHVSLPKLPMEIANLQPASGDTGGVFEIYTIDVVGKAFADVVPHADAQSRNMAFNLDAFPAADEMWFTGSIPN